MNISNEDRLNLKKLVDNAECENNTGEIRRLRHSMKIREDVRRIEVIKRVNGIMRETDFAQYEALCIQKCRFLYDNYNEIFNKIIKDELDLQIMSKMLVVLKMIEDEKVDQHEGSVLVGKLLADLYLDSAVKRADKLDKEYESMKAVPVEGKKISWKEYKMRNDLSK